jgi:predicted amidohydrolase YtcJ
MTEHDLILHNGQVVTLDGESRTVEAVAVTSGRITAVGSSNDLLRDAGRHTRVVDLDGRTACPGFIDTHAHMDREGLKARCGYSLAGRHSVAEIIEAVKNAVARTPKGEWIVFLPMGTPKLGYISRPDQLVEGRFPTRHDLDAVSPDNPVYIRVPWGWWVHRPFVAVANSAALSKAGIDRETEAPYNVQIQQDNQGPNGVFLDRSYAPVLEYTLFKCVPRITFEDRVHGCRLGAAAYTAAGTTSIYEGHGLTPAILEAYRRVYEDGDLSVRVHLPLSIPGASIDDRRMADVLNEWSSRLSGRGSGDDMYRLEGVCVDVANDKAAAIIGQDYPYEALAGHFYHSLPHDRFVEIGVQAAQRGIRLNCLICYDLERVLRAYEEIDRQVSIKDKRWVMIHVIEATPNQIARMKRLGVIATVTPNFMYMASDRFNLHEIGEHAMPIRSLIDAGVPVALTSDNVPYSMLWTMWEALARWDEDSKRRIGQANLSREEALRMVCQTGALVTWDETSKGTIELGKMGDLVVLEDNPLSCDEDHVKDICVSHTFLGGREVFGPSINDPGPIDGPNPG